jgi:hypothetical protein
VTRAAHGRREREPGEDDVEAPPDTGNDRRELIRLVVEMLGTEVEAA